MLSCRTVPVYGHTLSHGDILAGLDVEYDPTVDGFISTIDPLAGDWQVGVENQPRWSRITLVYCELL